MVEGRAVPPDRGDVGGVAAEQQRGSPPRRGRARRDARARPSARRVRAAMASARHAAALSAARPSIAASGASCASQRIALVHPPARGPADGRGARPASASRREHGLGLRLGAVGDEQVAARLGLDAVEGAGRGDDRAGHRHRLEHLVLDAAGDAERRDHHSGGGEPGADVGDLAGDDDAVASAERAHRRRSGWRPTMAKRASGRAARMRGSTSSAKPVTASTLGAVIHLAGEDDQRPRRRRRRAARSRRAGS